MIRYVTIGVMVGLVGLGVVSAFEAPARAARVKDGDTFVLTTGEEIRLLEIDAPELRGARCGAERLIAGEARDRLGALVLGLGLRLERRGRDRFGRTLAKVSVAGRDVGEVLLKEGYALPYQPGGWRVRPGPWCL